MAEENHELQDGQLQGVTGGRAVSGYVEYAVARGDTLDGIARKYHVTVRELAELNGIHNTSLLFIGQIIRVPVRIRC